jgi:putative transcriptional regulator
MRDDEENGDFASRLLEGLREAAAWSRREITLPVRDVATLTPERVKAIRKAVAKSPREFSRRFGIPARTLEGWEQGRRRPDPAASVLLRVIERNPNIVEDALRFAGPIPVPLSADISTEATGKD